MPRLRVVATPLAPSRPAGSMAAMRIHQKYRMRAPSSGREVIIEAEPGEAYVDRDTGEELEVVGAAAAARSNAVRAPVGGREPALLQLVRPAQPEGPQRLPDLRQAHGSPRLSVSPSPSAPRRSRIDLCPDAGLALSVGLVACGSGSTTADTSDVPPFTVPTSTAAPASNSDTTTDQHTRARPRPRARPARRRRRASARLQRPPATSAPSTPATSTPSGPATGGAGTGGGTAGTGGTGGTGTTGGTTTSSGSSSGGAGLSIGVLPAEPGRLLAPRRSGRLTAPGALAPRPVDRVHGHRRW